jgi:hypothetical protein
MQRRTTFLTLLAAAAAGVSACGGETVSTAPVAAFPMPGTLTASPESEISLRGAPADQLGEITVTGSKSGEHPGRMVAHKDGRGASFLPTDEFDDEETVTVRTELRVHGARDGDFTFATVGRPLEGLGSDRDPTSKDLVARREQRGGEASAGVPTFRSRPDLRPPAVEVRKPAGAGVADGFIFLSPKKVFGAKVRPGQQSGPAIVDDEGHYRWFADLEEGNVTDTRVQTVGGRRLLTFWAGRQILGTGEGEIQLYDETYRRVGSVKAGNGYQADFHETTLTDRGTALVGIYNPIDADLRKAGGPRDGRMLEPVVQEVEIGTGRVLFEWHGSQVLDIEDSNQPAPKDRGTPWDVFHNNSIVVDRDGNLIISGREFWQALKLDRRTGEVLWRLGGAKSDFKLGAEAEFAFQHDVQRAPDGTIRIFDNAASPPVRPQSRVLWLDLDERRRTVKVARQVEHPERLSAGTQGNAQPLPGGSTFVGWGSQGYFSEFDRDGTMLFDARLARGNDSYRAYRFPWVGRPRDRPDVAVEDGRVYVSWNGSTETRSWEVLAGAAPDALEPVAEADWADFETSIALPGDPASVAVRALDAAGKELSVSAPVAVRGS